MFNSAQKLPPCLSEKNLLTDENYTATKQEISPPMQQRLQWRSCLVITWLSQVMGRSYGELGKTQKTPEIRCSKLHT